MDEKKTHCRQCRVPILEATARRTNGYCMPHADLGLPFKTRIGGIITRAVALDPKTVVVPGITDFFLRLGMYGDWDRLMRAMVSGDTLIHFSTKPASEWEKSYVTSGYAIERDGQWIDGIVMKSRMNWIFYKGVESQISPDVFASERPELWEKFRPIFNEGDTIVYNKTSPRSWRILAGREWYEVRRNGKCVGSVLVALS